MADKSPPQCAHCDHTLCCDHCGREQPYDDVSILKADAARLRRVLGAIMQWPKNWNAPWEFEDEWQADKKLAEAALRGDPE